MKAKNIRLYSWIAWFAFGFTCLVQFFIYYTIWAHWPDIDYLEKIMPKIVLVGVPSLLPGTASLFVFGWITREKQYQKKFGDLASGEFPSFIKPSHSSNWGVKE